MRTARVIITFDCKRNCSYCSNKFTSIIDTAITIKSIDEMFKQKFDEVVITGGEPMLNPERTMAIISRIKKINDRIKVFMYTANYNSYIQTILKSIDGITYSIHENSSEEDAKDLLKMQAEIIGHKNSKSLRLYVNQSYPRKDLIIPSLWHRIKIENPLTENKCKIPDNEILFILKERV